MMTVPACYYTRKILNLVDDMIGDGHMSYDELEDMDKDRLTVACMDVHGEDAYFFITDADDINSVVVDLKKFLFTACDIADYGYSLLNKDKKQRNRDSC